MLDELIDERHFTHGDWKQVSSISQGFKSIADPYDIFLDDEQHEALDQIFTKIARILAGDPSHTDHWKDIAGYATLGSGDYNVGSRSKSLSYGSGLAEDQKPKATRKRRERSTKLPD